jgi:hypothetical protein
MLVKKKTLSVIAVVAALTAILGLAWNGASGSSEPEAAGVSNVTGDGETLLLVIADVVPAAQAAARLDLINRKFGDLQGFYADPSDGYEVTGALLQTSVDLATEPCLEPLEPLHAGALLDDDCPIGGVASVIKPITTTLVDLTDLPKAETASLCVLSGDSCGLTRVRQLLGEDLRLDGGAALVTTGFRTKRGAQEFLDLARAAGVTDLVTLQVRRLFGGDIGLGQEPAPDGSGPLTSPLAGQEQYQR